MVFICKTEVCIVTEDFLSGQKKFKNLKIWFFIKFKNSKNRSLNIFMIKRKICNIFGEPFYNFKLHIIIL